MATKLRLFAALCALVAAVVVVCETSPGSLARARDVQLRSTALPLDSPSTTIKWPVIDTIDAKAMFAPCDDIPIDVVQKLGLGFTPPEAEEGQRCHYDSANYQLTIEPIYWRTYDQSLPPDSIETTVDGHRAAWFWVLKPSTRNNRYYFSCMVTFKTSYGVIQQTLFFSPIYSNPDVDCPTENMMRANQLAPYYKF